MRLLRLSDCEGSRTPALCWRLQAEQSHLAWLSLSSTTPIMSVYIESNTDSPRRKRTKNIRLQGKSADTDFSMKDNCPMIQKMRLDNRIQPIIFLEDPYKLSQIIIPSIFLLDNKDNVTREAFRAKQCERMCQKSVAVSRHKRGIIWINIIVSQ